MPHLRDWNAAIEDAKAAAREQLQAAWLAHLDRVHEQLQAAWKEQMTAVVDQRLAELDQRLRVAMAGASAERAMAESAAAVREVTSRLNQALRRIRGAETGGERLRALADAAGGFCGRAGVFALEGGNFRLDASAGWFDQASLDGLRQTAIPVRSAPAMAAAIESGDMVVAMGGPGEISEAASAFFEGSANRRVFLFPIGGKAVLYAEPGANPVDPNALEMLAAAAGIREEPAPAVESADELVTIAMAAPSNEQESPLSREEQDLHRRAQRFARAKAAEMMLYRFPDVKKGRSEGNIYGTLRQEIESGRHAFRERFLSASPSMADYFHRELVQMLANGDAGLLGEEYPGPLA